MLCGPRFASVARVPKMSFAISFSNRNKLPRRPFYLRAPVASHSLSTRGVRTRMKDGLAERVAVVTGGAQGIGAACAEALVEAGSRVAILDVNAQTGERVAARLGEAVTFFLCDVGRSADVDKAFAAIRDHMGDPTLLLNNAAVAKYAPFMEVTEEIWDETLRVNLKGTYLCSRAAIPGMLRSGGIHCQHGECAGLSERIWHFRLRRKQAGNAGTHPDYFDRLRAADSLQRRLPGMYRFANVADLRPGKERRRGSPQEAASAAENWQAGRGRRAGAFSLERPLGVHYRTGLSARWRYGIVDWGSPPEWLFWGNTRMIREGKVWACTKKSGCKTACTQTH